MERGKAYNPRHVTQVRDYSGLRWGNITPTDIDIALDFQNKVWVFAELKYGTDAVPLGQRLALERLCENHTQAGCTTFSVIARHNNASKDGEIKAHLATVELYYWRLGGKWQWLAPETHMTLKAFIDGVLSFAKMRVQDAA